MLTVRRVTHAREPIALSPVVALVNWTRHRVRVLVISQLIEEVGLLALDVNQVLDLAFLELLVGFFKLLLHVLVLLNSRRRRTVLVMDILINHMLLKHSRVDVISSEGECQLRL